MCGHREAPEKVNRRGCGIDDSPATNAEHQGRSSQLEQILMNLAVNAAMLCRREAHSRDGVVELVRPMATTSRAKAAILYARSQRTGTGMDSQTMARF